MKTGSIQILILLLFIAGLISSCGKAKELNFDKFKKNFNEQVYKQQEDEGIYRATLLPINPEKHGHSEGAIEVKIEGDHVVVSTNMNEVHSGIKHYQNIMTHTSCPDLSDDHNADSYVDIVEAIAKTGQILIPLDSNIGNQLRGIDYGPIANSMGQYVYKRSTSLTELLVDLRSPDPDLTDSIVKLPFGTDLNLSGRAVLIHGIRPSDDLPEDLLAIGNHKSFEIMPVACGILQRVIPENGL